MPGLYTHLSQRDTEGAIRRMHGIETEESQHVKLKPITCKSCGKVNSPGSKFCNGCGTILTLETAMNVNNLLQVVMREAPGLLSKSNEEILKEHESRSIPK